MLSHFIFTFCPISSISQAVVKDEIPDTWDDDDDDDENDDDADDDVIDHRDDDDDDDDVEQQQMKGVEDRKKDKDLEFLLQEIARDVSLDESLKRDLQSKKTHPKYKEMLVSFCEAFGVPLLATQCLVMYLCPLL